MSVDWIPRSAWKARSPKGGYSAMPSHVKGVKVHYTGGHVDPALVNDHAKCVAAVRGIQNGHMDGNGWLDIGYSYVVCPHRKVFDARGWNHLPAANGPGLNSGHYAVLGLVGNSGLVEPPDAMLHGIRDVIEYLRGRGVGSEIRGHRDGYSTDCPGAKLYAWVKKGAPRPGGTVTPPPADPEPGSTTKPPLEDESMDYTSLGLSATGMPAIPANTWTDVLWDTEYADEPKDHVDAGANASFLNGPARYTLDLELALTGLTGLEDVVTRVVEVKAGTSPGEVLEATQPRAHTTHVDTDGKAVLHHSGIGAISEGRKLRLQIRHTQTVRPVKVSEAWARMLSNPA